MLAEHTMAIRNKLKIIPTDEDKPSYAGVTSMKLSVQLGGAVPHVHLFQGDEDHQECTGHSDC